MKHKKIFKGARLTEPASSIKCPVFLQDGPIKQKAFQSHPHDLLGPLSPVRQLRLNFHGPWIFSSGDVCFWNSLTRAHWHTCWCSPQQAAAKWKTPPSPHQTGSERQLIIIIMDKVMFNMMWWGTQTTTRRWLTTGTQDSSSCVTSRADLDAEECHWWFLVRMAAGGRRYIKLDATTHN